MKHIFKSALHVLLITTLVWNPLFASSGAPRSNIVAKPENVLKDIQPLEKKIIEKLGYKKALDYQLVRSVVDEVMLTAHVQKGVLDSNAISQLQKDFLLYQSFLQEFEKVKIDLKNPLADGLIASLQTNTHKKFITKKLLLNLGNNLELAKKSGLAEYEISIRDFVEAFEYLRPTVHHKLLVENMDLNKLAAFLRVNRQIQFGKVSVPSWASTNPEMAMVRRLFQNKEQQTSEIFSALTDIIIAESQLVLQKGSPDYIDLKVLELTLAATDKPKLSDMTDGQSLVLSKLSRLAQLTTSSVKINNKLDFSDLGRDARLQKLSGLANQLLQVRALKHVTDNKFIKEFLDQSKLINKLMFQVGLIAYEDSRLTKLFNELIDLERTFRKIVKKGASKESIEKIIADLSKKSKELMEIQGDPDFKFSKELREVEKVIDGQIAFVKKYQVILNQVDKVEKQTLKVAQSGPFSKFFGTIKSAIPKALDFVFKAGQMQSEVQQQDRARAMDDFRLKLSDQLKSIKEMVTGKGDIQVSMKEKAQNATQAPQKQNITPDQLKALVTSIETGRRSKDGDPLILELQELAGTKKDPMIIENPRYKNLGKDPTTGEELLEINIKTIGKNSTTLSKEFSFTVPINRERAMQEASPSAVAKAWKSHFGNGANYTIKHVLPEAPPFYIGLFINSFINLSVRFEKDPLALQRYVDELVSPAGQLSFVAFMMGSGVARSVLEQFTKDLTTLSQLPQTQQNKHRIRAFFKSSVRMFIPFMAMGVGTLFSNIYYDIITLTKPCADAMWNNMPHEMMLKECDKGFKAVLYSDKFYEYVASTFTVMSASFMASLTQALGRSAVAGARTVSPRINSLVVKLDENIFSHIKPSGNNFWTRSMATRILSPVMVGVSIYNILLFFQWDPLLAPSIHHQVEKWTNSGADLNRTAGNLEALMNHMAQNGWSDSLCKPWGEIYSNSSDIIGGLQPSIAQISENETNCNPGKLFSDYVQFQEKWRESLKYEFTAGYYSWQQIINEYNITAQISKDFNRELTLYIANKEDAYNPKARLFNPLVHEDPFYGVIPEPEAGYPEEMQELFKKWGFDPNVLETLYICNKDDYANLPINMRAEDDEALKNLLSKEGINSYCEYKHYRELEIDRIRRIIYSKYKAEEILKSLEANYEDASKSRLSSTIIDEDNVKAIISGLSLYIKNIENFENLSAEVDGELYSGLDLLSALHQTNKVDNKTFNGMYKPLIEALNLLNSLNEKYKKVSSGGIVIAKVGGNFQTATQAVKGIKDLRMFVGNPKPLKARESFFVRFDEKVKRNNPDFAKHLERNWYEYSNSEQRKTVSNTLMYYAVCGEDYTNQKIEDIQARIDSGNFEEPITAAQSDKIMGKFTWGTNVYLKYPRVVDVKGSAKHALLCSNATPTYSPTSDFNKNLSVRENYASLLDYAVNNLAANVRGSLDETYLDRSYLTWWNYVMIPKIQNQFLNFEKQYHVLLNEHFMPALSGCQIKDESDFECVEKTFSGNQKIERKHLPTSLYQSYMKELDSYLKILNGSYAGHVRETILSKYPKLDSTRKERLIKHHTDHFQNALNELRSRVENMLKSFILYAASSSGNRELDLPTFYASILQNLGYVLAKMGYINRETGEENFSKIAEKLGLEKHGVLAGPMSPLGLFTQRTKLDQLISEPYSAFLQAWYTEENFKKLQSENSHVPHIQYLSIDWDKDTSNNQSRALVSAMATSNLISMLELMYNNVAIMKAATYDASKDEIGDNFKNTLEEYKDENKGVGTRRGGS